MDKLREELYVQMSLEGRLVKRQLKWAGHLERIEEDRFLKRVDVSKELGGIKMSRPRLRWEYCVTRDVRKVEME